MTTRDLLEKRIRDHAERVKLFRRYAKSIRPPSEDYWGYTGTFRKAAIRMDYCPNQLQNGEAVFRLKSESGKVIGESKPWNFYRQKETERYEQIA